MAPQGRRSGALDRGEVTALSGRVHVELRGPRLRQHAPDDLFEILARHHIGVRHHLLRIEGAHRQESTRQIRIQLVDRRRRAPSRTKIAWRER